MTIATGHLLRYSDIDSAIERLIPLMEDIHADSLASFIIFLVFFIFLFPASAVWAKDVFGMH